MASFKVNILRGLSGFFARRSETYANLELSVRKTLFFEQLEERDDDIYIITFMKSGTTWMQMICYQLLTDGNMDFKHIYDVSPWLSNAAKTGVDPASINELPSPRVFKSHDRYDLFDSECTAKFIFVYRQPDDVAVSFLHHLRNYTDTGYTVDRMFEEYFDINKEVNWFSFTQAWLKNTYGLNILYVNYADLKNDFDNSLKRIAAFLEVELTDEIAQRVKERSSFEFMKAHEEKFGEQPRDKRVYDQFIREGKVGAGKELSQEHRDFIMKMHHQFIKPLEKRLD